MERQDLFVRNCVQMATNCDSSERLGEVIINLF